MKKERHPIIANGEMYVEPIIKKSHPSDKEYPHEYSEAKAKLIDDIKHITDIFTSTEGTTNEVFIEEKIICFRLEPKFEAKSYVPYSIISASEEMRIVGGRQYSIDEETTAKLYFVKTTSKALSRLYDVVQSGSKDHVESWQQQVRSLHSVDLLTQNEKILGFEEEWAEGTVEVVLHPIGDNYQNSIDAFFANVGIDKKSARIRTYDDGLTFICLNCSKDQIKDVSRLNVLRTIHPLGKVEIMPIRNNRSISHLPNVENTGMKSTIKVGVFDGGANETHPLLKNYVTNIDATSSKAITECVDHGTAVCGIVLHGQITPNSTLPTPCVTVDSYRVLPPLNMNDIELYEVIDSIENIVPSATDTHLYNISLGPHGAILDDCISRFTYALDKLTYDMETDGINPLFCIAAGNDGDLIYPCNRIQSPSDMVNGLSVGAYTFSNDGSKIRADYSCVGEGREGAKIKPDVLEFGGSQLHPFIVAANNKDGIGTGSGTSFSSPLVANKIGRLMANSQNITPHMGRALIIHSSEYSPNDTIVNQGFGFCSQNIESILTCEDNDVTILYVGKLHEANTAKLPIFSPHINDVPGMVEIKWTIATIVDPYINDTDAYTNNCIEDTFYPHDATFNFTKGKKIKKLNLSNPTDASQVKALLDDGYKRSALPASKSSKRFADESELRSIDLKWDTVIRKSQRMRGSSLLNPFLTLHAMSRNDFNDSFIKYFVAISIKAPKYKGSLYDAILQANKNLTPITIRNINHIMISS